MSNRAPSDDEQPDYIGDGIKDIIHAAMHRQLWVSVKDRLPEPGSRVMVYCRYDKYSPGPNVVRYGEWGYYGVSQPIGFYDWHDGQDTDYGYEGVTHWMYLPEPPRE